MTTAISRGLRKPSRRSAATRSSSSRISRAGSNSTRSGTSGTSRSAAARPARRTTMRRCSRGFTRASKPWTHRSWFMVERPRPAAVRNGWLERVLEQVSLPFMDALSIHTYTYSETGRARGPEAWAEWLGQVGKMTQKYSHGKPVPLYVTETGWPTQIDRRGTPPDVAAAYLASMDLLARTMPFLKGIWWYDFQDDGWNASINENNFGMVRPDLTPKPAYFSLADIAKLVSKAEFAGRVETGDPDIWALKFREPDGIETWAI